MKDTMKKSLGIMLATVCMSTAFVGCATTQYKGDVLDGPYDKTATVSSNGGFAVEQGDYVYFINGKESYEKSNKYGEVVKSALMRIKKSDLAQGKYDDVKTVVPSLFVAQNYDAGIYIYDEYVYYATPTTYNTMEGTVGNTHIDFKRAKLDGTEAPMKDPFFHLSNNASKYRFVEVNDVVYCLYEENGALKSYNTATGANTVLVSGAKSTFFYDVENASNPNVYYTMNVKASLNGSNAGYDQLYCVRADATVTATDKNKASYTVSNGYTYDFDEVEMKEANDEAKATGGKEKYDFSDYTTYPYVNLGTLVLDGVGKNSTKTQYTHDDMAGCIETSGYTYEVKSYRDGGLYFTRKAVQSTGSDGEDAKLYYVADTTVTADGWNTVTGNAETALEIVATNTANTDSALFYKDGKKHYYIYIADGYIYKAGYDNTGTGARIDAIQMTRKSVGSATPWKLDKTNKLLYYYVAKAEGKGNGNTLSKISYAGEYGDYNAILAKEEYQPVSLDYVDFNNAADWYMPEFIGDKLLYGNAQSFGNTSYTYVYATKLGTSAEIKANNEKYEEVQTFIKDENHSEKIQNVMQYYFRTGKTDLYNAVIDEYSSSQQTKITEFIEKFGAGKEFENALESNYIGLVGKLTEDDAMAIEESFKESLEKPEETLDESGLDAWIIWTIVGVGVALIVAGVVTAILVARAKKKAKKAEEEKIVNAHKKRISVEDDKTIDVYADDTPETEATESTEVETVEAEPTVEEVVEETVAEPTAETAEETESTQESTVENTKD